MKNNNKNLDVLIDIRFYESMNKFEEIYGEGVSYRKLEQETYVELKSMIFDFLGKKIKFKKCRDLEKDSNPMVLTVKAEMTNNEYEKVCNLHSENKLFFLYDFIVSNIRILQE